MKAGLSVHYWCFEHKQKRSGSLQKERGDGAHRVRLLSAARRTGMRRNAETWRSGLSTSFLFACSELPAGHKTLLRKKSHRQQVVPSSAAAAEAGTLLKAEAHDDDWRPEFERSCSEPRACLKSLLAVDRSTCPPGAHPTPSPPSFPSCSSSPPLSKRTSHLSTPASTTHLADIISHGGDSAPWGLKHEGEN